MKQKIAVILVFVLLLNIIPVGVFAAKPETQSTEEPATEKSSAMTVSADAWDGTVAKGFARGEGSEFFPYIIETPEQLAYLAKSVNDNVYTQNGVITNDIYFALAADIDLGGREWTPIGLATDFYGHFYGNGYTITGLAMTKFGKTAGTSTFQGLFGTINEGATVQDLRVKDAKMSGTLTEFDSVTVGFIAAENSGTITDCEVSGSMTFTGATTCKIEVGGICGEMGGNFSANKKATHHFYIVSNTILRAFRYNNIQPL